MNLPHPLAAVLKVLTLYVYCVFALLAVVTVFFQLTGVVLIGQYDLVIYLAAPIGAVAGLAAIRQYDTRSRAAGGAVATLILALIFFARSAHFSLAGFLGAALIGAFIGVCSPVPAARREA